MAPRHAGSVGGSAAVTGRRRRAWLRRPLVMLALLGAWTALVLVGAWGGWGRQPLAPADDVEGFLAAARQALIAGQPGNAVLHLLEQGEVVGRIAVSRGTPVDGDAVFQVASVSKWVAAWGVLTLVEAGALDLDRPVSTWLTRWDLPPSPFDHDGVTVRRLLSHTAGLVDGLGYGGFAPGQELQSLEDSLTRAADACCGLDGRVRVGRTPGAGWQYSGGGYTLLQLLVEEVTGEGFEAYLERAVLRPLGMHRSTFDIAAAEARGLAPVYDRDGAPAPPYRFTATAAASLYTTAADLGRFLAAHHAGPDGAPPGRGVLRPDTLEHMREVQARFLGVALWGLGPMLYVNAGGGRQVIGHDGHNAPAINTSARLQPATGHGIVVLATGTPDLATGLAAEWVFWRTGRIDAFAFAARAPVTLGMLAAGWVVLVLLGVAFAWRRR